MKPSDNMPFITSSRVSQKYELLNPEMCILFVNDKKKWVCRAEKKQKQIKRSVFNLMWRSPIG